MNRTKTTAPRLAGQSASADLGTARLHAYPSGLKAIVVNAVPKIHDGANVHRSETMKALIGIFGLILALGGCKKECFILPGTYSMSLTPKAGDCPENIIGQFSGYTDEVSIPPATACTRFLTTIEGAANNCQLTMDVSAKADPTGLHDGVGIFRVACEDEYACRHEFDVTFKPVAATP